MLHTWEYFFLLNFSYSFRKIYFFLLSFLLNYHNSNFPLGFLAVQNVNGLFQHRNEMNFIWITNYICIIAHVKILFLTQAHNSGARLCLSAMYGPFDFIVWPSIYYICSKVQIFWEGPKNLKKCPSLFRCY